MTFREEPIQTKIKRLTYFLEGFLMMLDNSSYNKIKLLYKLSDLQWFIEKHAINDAQEAGDKACVEMLLAIQRDLQKHVEKLHKAACVITQ